MLLHLPSVERLIEAFRRLPGVGKRSAERFALHLLAAPEEDAIELGKAILEARRRVRRCTRCGNLAETDPCEICTDEKRDRSVLCVVERPAGVIALEGSGGFRGLYHVLHGVISPLDGVGPDDLRIDKLITRVKEEGIREVILATNATVEGENTALYISHLLEPLGVSVTRIAHGVPMGSGLEYADGVTLTRALAGRTKI
ncbi:MAG TPA: recombination mediator RecR [Candidatus Hydrogenedentes bacterium]|nr:recombination mediator RecR [Candidatus Hydrogenedentota bacterium]HOL76193.1 recombination mediator RecR [Candidatus Hydrogenedentota bacterium]HPO85994.1 recombination mediator RecR [Candidatus Hydrogenedentota bacterium]